ncbi:MAG TPA: hypothetical protein VGC09_00500 [Rhodopila sp.]
MTGVYLLLGLAAVGLAAPMIVEKSNSSCEAVATAIIAASPPPPGGISPTALSIVGAPFIEYAVKTRNPDVPAFLSCTALWWRVQVNGPDGLFAPDQTKTAYQ